MDISFTLVTPSRDLKDFLLKDYPGKLLERDINVRKCSCGRIFYVVDELDRALLMPLLEKCDEDFDLCEFNGGRIYHCFTRIGNEISLTA